ncbi:hypothetical protein AC1031_007182 [Aphanomyces cochlioides]|nr:hypothetical protein AC1031_007182 [Aphanomyces cochlioides]
MAMEDKSTISGLLSRMTSFRFTLSDSDTSQAEANAAPPQVGQEVHLKIALVGGHGVGKSSIVRRWLKRPYQAAYHQTIGVDVQTIKYPYMGNPKEIIHLHIWDVSSVEVDSPGFHELLCDGLDGVFFVFNIHRVSSIAAVDGWRTSLSKYISASEVPCYLLSHKADMLQKRVMTSDDIEAYARTAGYKGWSWTVGRGGLGESDKNPAVFEVLDKMVEFICQGKSMNELLHDRYHVPSEPDILEPMTPRVLPMTESLPFSSEVLHVPTQAITTIPRQGEEGKGNTFGGDWMFGEQKGQYLVVNSRESVDMTDTDNEETEAPPQDEDDGWRYFAGTIDRIKTEQILSTQGEGAFLVRRKDSRTLVLSYKGSDDVHHVLIEYHDGRYHVGTKSPSQPSFSSLAKCLRSVRKYAYKGLTFKRNRRFQVGKRMDLDIVDPNDKKTTKSTWTTYRARRESTQMETTQEQVQVPAMQRLVEVAEQFYIQVKHRLEAIERHAADTTQIKNLRNMVWSMTSSCR